jgi:hypothetical protein
MFPFVWAFAWAVWDLLRRFARGTEARLLPLVVLSPAVLPAVNLMLDVPAFGLGLAAVAVFARAAGRHSWRLAIVAGLIAGVAMQTKYTALLVPPAVAWYGLARRRIGLAAVSVFVSVAVFAGWESLLLRKYGESHFAHHATAAGGGTLAAWAREKADLGGPLVGHLGCLGVGVGLVAAAAVGVPRRGLAFAAGAWAIGFAAILVVPHRWTVLVPAAVPGGVETTAVNVFWQTSGMLVLAVLAGCAGLLAVRFKPLRLRRSADTLFVVGWLLIELGGYFALTPFGAARRLIGLVAVGGVLAGRALSRVERIRPDRRLPGWVVWFGIAAGVAVAGIDTLDAFPEQFCSARAAAMAAELAPGPTVWFAGHWGFQFHCERAGMRHLVPGESVPAAGDVLVLPAHPDEHRLYRPHVGSVPVRPPAGAAEVIGEVLWLDPLSATTIPNYYCGVDPVAGRDHPRLRVVVYRLARDWAVPGR